MSNGSDRESEVQCEATMEVLVQRRPKRIRLFGIDAPERDQAFGSRAREAAGVLAFGQAVKVVSHGMDQYGRILGEVVLPDGSILNERLVEQGWAWHYTRYSNSRRLAEMEISARRARRGLWADPRPIPPWEFRRTRRGSATTAR
jgi:micrococcal nuclease